MADSDNVEAAKLIEEARALVNEVPIDADTASQSDFNAVFSQKRKTADTEVTGRQAEVEQEWDTKVKANYIKAKELAEQAQSML